MGSQTKRWTVHWSGVFRNSTDKTSRGDRTHQDKQLLESNMGSQTKRWTVHWTVVFRNSTDKFLGMIVHIKTKSFCNRTWGRKRKGGPFIGQWCSEIPPTNF
ncbi:hypothetical protein AVEN_184877-1 [Araneus ventricosus]|uniref:Uncharacterized protein n=1 Tax=Araneus ventricosus TaxID=182803 RepID=A0A4Y2RSD9_ARAVE|nr:hypothetical protein AVEN_184877-1 [Araneus ventricosus]